MIDTKLILQVLEPQSDFDKIMIGNSKFNDDVWDLRPFIKSKVIVDSHKYVNFKYITNKDMRLVTKQYAYYRLGKVKPQSVYYDINGRLPNFIEYCLINKINSFKDITQDDLLKFSLWLKDKKKVATQTGYASAKVVEEIINIGQIKGWNVPQLNIFKGASAYQLWANNQAKQKIKANKTYSKGCF